MRDSGGIEAIVAPQRSQEAASFDSGGTEALTAFGGFTPVDSASRAREKAATPMSPHQQLEGRQMDEIRRLRFFIPVALYVLAIAVSSRSTFRDGIRVALELTGGNNLQAQAQPSIGLIPATALLALGASFAIAFGFVISTIVQAVLQHVAIRKGPDFRVCVHTGVDDILISATGAPPDATRAEHACDLPFVAYSAFQHSVPEPLAAWLSRRWEMFMVSWNSVAAIFLAGMTTIWHKLGFEMRIWWILIMLLFVWALYMCIRRTRDESGVMTDYLAHGSNWGSPHINKTAFNAVGTSLPAGQEPV